MDSNISMETTIGFAIVLCLAAFILSIFVFVKPDEKLDLNEDGLVDPNYITINSFLETSKAKTYMTNYLNTYMSASTQLLTKNNDVNIFINTNKVGTKTGSENQGAAQLFNCNKTNKCVNEKSFLLL